MILYSHLLYATNKKKISIELKLCLLFAKILDSMLCICMNKYLLKCNELAQVNIAKLHLLRQKRNCVSSLL